MNKIRILERFLVDPLGWRNTILAQGFQDYHCKDGATYQYVSQPELSVHPYLSNRLNSPVDIAVEGARGNPTGANTNGFPYVHADPVMQASHAFVLYLNTDEQLAQNPGTGTGFFRHKATGRVQMPVKGTVPDDLFNQLEKDWYNKDAWEMYYLCPAKFNRLLTYDCNLFHARVPHDGFGTTPEDFRLIWVGFYNLPE